MSKPETKPETKAQARREKKKVKDDVVFLTRSIDILKCILEVQQFTLNRMSVATLKSALNEGFSTVSSITRAYLKETLTVESADDGDVKKFIREFVGSNFCPETCNTFEKDFQSTLDAFVERKNAKAESARIKRYDKNLLASGLVFSLTSATCLNTIDVSVWTKSVGARFVQLGGPLSMRHPVPNPDHVPAAFHTVTLFADRDAAMAKVRVFEEKKVTTVPHVIEVNLLPDVSRAFGPARSSLWLVCPDVITSARIGYQGFASRVYTDEASIGLGLYAKSNYFPNNREEFCDLLFVKDISAESPARDVQVARQFLEFCTEVGRSSITHAFTNAPLVDLVQDYLLPECLKIPFTVKKVTKRLLKESRKRKRAQK